MENIKKDIVKNSFQKALKVASIYCLLGGLWILLSDKILLLFIRDTATYAWIQTIKGWVYVVFTAAVILLLVFRELKKSDILASENEVLLRELHHRTKNNLQMITSLLNLNSRKAEFSQETLRILADVQAQVQAISLVHQKLIGNPVSPWVRLDSYIRELARDLGHIHRGLVSHIDVHFSIESVEVSLDKITSIGMIVSELITNSYKHGFSDRNTGNIALTAALAEEGKQLVISVQDNGVGMAATGKEHYGLGFSLIEALIEQLSGSIEIHSEHGVTVTARIPMD